MQNTTFCVTLLYTPHLIMKKTTKNSTNSPRAGKKLNAAKAAKKHALEREHKDITCAVRLPKTMYDNLCKAAQVEGLSLSDIIRDALVRKMEAIFEKQRQRMLKEAEFEAQMRKYGSDGSHTRF